MEQKKLSEFTAEELQKKKYLLAGALLVIALVWLAISGLSMYRLITGEEFDLLMLFPFILIPVFMPIVNLFRQTTAEIRSRKPSV